uniref:Lipase domain-containing protein n=1 Tax=Anopheles atroparvus TaxID=41427 RepID=A0AAG5DQ74_ANOAO
MDYTTRSAGRLCQACLAVTILLSCSKAHELPSLDTSKVHTVEQFSKLWRKNFQAYNCSLQTHIEWSPISEDVTFWCFNRKTGKFRYTLNDLNDFGDILEHNQPTVLFIHGWLQDRTQFAKEVKQLSLATADRNYCLVDFEPLAHIELEPFRDLVSPRVATYVAGFVQGLGSIGIPPRQVTLVGEGVTAHLAGHVGAILEGNLGAIIGLDPLGPFFTTGPKLQTRRLTLDPSDARWVQVWYTSVGQLGSSIPLGHQNIYINGGLHPQPYCACFSKTFGANNLLTELCSHNFAVKVFKASFDPSIDLVATRCRNYKDFLAGSCDNRKAAEPTGDGTDAGRFYIETSCRPPFLLHPSALQEQLDKLPSTAHDSC